MELQIGKQLRALRTKRKLSQESIARGAGITLRHYQKIENGQTENPGIQTVLSILNAIEASWRDLFDNPNGNR